jgi:hypothetical protein
MSQDNSESGKDGQRGRNAAAWIGAIGGIAAAVIGGVFVLIAALEGGSTPPTASNPTDSISPNTSTPSQRSTPTSSIASINLTRLSTVPECAAISGYVSPSVAAGKQLWLFMKITKPSSNRPSNTFYFLNPLHPDSLGVWSTEIQLGERGGDNSLYWLDVASSDPSLTGPVTIKDIKDLRDGSMQGIPRNFNHPPLTNLEVVRGVSNSARHDVCHTYVAISSH